MQFLFEFISIYKRKHQDFHDLPNWLTRVNLVSPKRYNNNNNNNKIIFIEETPITQSCFQGGPLANIRELKNHDDDWK